MKTRHSLYLALLLFISSVACSGPAPSEEAPLAARKEEQVGILPKNNSERNVLHVEREMLRDLKLTIAEAESRLAGESSLLLGELRVNENAYAEVGAPIASRLIAFHAGAGQSLRAGQSLATLQSTELGRARSEVIAAQARLELAKQALERKRRLASERIVAQREVQEAEATLAGADAEVRAALAALRALGAADAEEEHDSSQYELKTPIGGTVIERRGAQGAMVGPEETLFRIGDLSSLWLTVQAFERDAIRIREGSPVHISFPALPGSTFRGKIDLVGRQVSGESRTVAIRIIVPNHEGVLRPGMSANARALIGTSTGSSITVPAAALQRIEGEWVVFVPTENAEAFEVRTVGRGRDLGGEVELLSGLKPKERVVVDGAFLLKSEVEKAHGEGEHHDH